MSARRDDFGVSGDPDNDGDLDGADFLTWQRRLGTLPMTAASTVSTGEIDRRGVPEPTTACMAMTPIVLILVWRRRFGGTRGSRLLALSASRK